MWEKDEDVWVTLLLQGDRGLRGETGKKGDRGQTGQSGDKGSAVMNFVTRYSITGW